MKGMHRSSVLNRLKTASGHLDAVVRREGRTNGADGRPAVDSTSPTPSISQS